MSTQRGFDFVGPITFDTKALIVAPSRHAASKETSALAAAGNHPYRATQNDRLLALLQRAGDRGLADPVIQRITGWERSTICARRADVGTVPATKRWSHPKNGRTYTRWRLATDDERRADEQPAVRDLLKATIECIENRETR